MAGVRGVVAGGDLERPSGIAAVPADHHAVLRRQHALHRRERLRHDMLARPGHDHLGHAHRAVDHEVGEPRLRRLEHPPDQVAEQRLLGRRQQVVLHGRERALRHENQRGIAVRARQLLDRRSPQHRLGGGRRLRGKARLAAGRSFGRHTGPRLMPILLSCHITDCASRAYATRRRRAGRHRSVWRGRDTTGEG